MGKGLVYAHRSAAGSNSNTPTDWPFGWNYPPEFPYPTSFNDPNIPGINWPPGWPVNALPATVVVCDSPTTLSIGGSGAGTVETYITVGGVEADASFYRNHLLLITATHNGNVVNVKGPNDIAAGAGACIKVTNYNGNRWGGSGTFTFTLAGLNDTIDLVVRGRLITAQAVASDTDLTDLIS